MSDKKQNPRNPSCDIIMTPYSSWTSLSSLPRKGQTEVIHCYVSMSLLHPLWGKGSTFLAASFTSLLTECTRIKYCSCTWKQEKPGDSQGQWPFSKTHTLWTTHPTFLSVRETHTLFKVRIMNETKSSSRRKPAGQQFRKEMLHSVSMFSVPNSLGTRQKMK